MYTLLVWKASMLINIKNIKNFPSDNSWGIDLLSLKAIKFLKMLNNLHVLI